MPDVDKKAEALRKLGHDIRVMDVDLRLELRAIGLQLLECDAVGAHRRAGERLSAGR